MSNKFSAGAEAAPVVRKLIARIPSATVKPSSSSATLMSPSRNTLNSNTSKRHGKPTHKEGVRADTGQDVPLAQSCRVNLIGR